MTTRNMQYEVKISSHLTDKAVGLFIQNGVILILPGDRQSRVILLREERGARLCLLNSPQILRSEARYGDQCKQWWIL